MKLLNCKVVKDKSYADLEAQVAQAARTLKLFDEERSAFEWLRDNAPARNLPFSLRPRMREVLGE